MGQDKAKELSSDLPVFCVITTLYNSNATIQKTFDSMLAQTYPNIIHYIYDDDSPQNPDALVQRYLEAVKQRKEPYKVIYEKGVKNLGVDLAHQHCFAKMTGSFFTWLDSGDYLNPRFFEIIAKEAKKHPECTWFKPDFYSYDAQGVQKKTWVSQKMSKHNLKRRDQLPNNMFGKDVIYAPGAYSIAAFRSVNSLCLIDDAKTTEAPYYDVQIFREFALNHQPMRYINRPLSYYLRDPHSASKDSKTIHNQVDEGMISIFSRLGYTENQISFYRDYYGLKQTILDVEGYCLLGQPKKAIESYHTIKRFLKDRHLPAFYFPNKKRTFRFYVLAKVPFFLHLYKTIRHLK